MGNAFRASFVLVCLFIICTFVQIDAFAEDGLSTTCRRVNSTPEWTYCLSEDPTSANKEILINLHGFLDEQHAWVLNSSYAELRRAWRNLGKELPRVITVSYGRMWLLSDLNSSPLSGKFGHFMTSVLPELESIVGSKMSEEPWKLLGASMGGFNAVQLMLRNPELWSRVAIVCPALSELSPHSSTLEIIKYTRETGAKLEQVMTMIHLGKKNFPTPESWHDADPLVLGETLLGPQTPPLYVSGGDRDEWGFYGGALRFAELAQSRGVDTTWHPMPGRGHCSYDPQTVAEFLSQ